MSPLRIAARSALAGTGLAAARHAPASRAAQSVTPAGIGGEVYFSHNTSFPVPRLLAGAALSMGAGPIVVRGSGALNRVTDDFDQTETPWTADADLMLNTGALGQMAGILLGGFAPVGFVGIGTQGIYRATGERPVMPNYSYGAGASMHLFDGIRVGAEARWRTPIGSVEALPAGFGAGREVKLGIAFGFGAGSGMRTSSGAGASRGGASSSGTRFPSVPASASARAVLGTADDYVGVPYVWGGESPRGFDCSGFTQYVFRKNGIELPRTSRQQVQVGSKVTTSLSSLRTGDLIFFAENYSRVDHVAIYAGDGRIIHATSSGGEVRYDDLRSQRGAWFMDHIVAALRYTGNTTAWEGILSQLLTEAVKQYDKGDKAPRP